MQTFLPYPDFDASARVLDRQRLGKQRVECKQIYLALNNPSYGWQNHPCTRMWRNHDMWLLLYACAICREWRRRGYKDTLLPFFASHWDYARKHTSRAPPWLGRQDVHESHQSNLLRKKPNHYGQFGWPVPPTLEYVWPVEEPTYAIASLDLPFVRRAGDSNQFHRHHSSVDSNLLRPLESAPTRLRLAPACSPVRSR